MAFANTFHSRSQCLHLIILLLLCLVFRARAQKTKCEKNGIFRRFNNLFAKYSTNPTTSFVVMQIHQTSRCFVIFLRINEFSWEQYTIIDILNEEFNSVISIMVVRDCVVNCVCGARTCIAMCVLPLSSHPIATYVAFVECCYRKSIPLNRRGSKHV